MSKIVLYSTECPDIIGEDGFYCIHQFNNYDNVSEITVVASDVECNKFVESKFQFSNIMKVNNIITYVINEKLHTIIIQYKNNKINFDVTSKILEKMEYFNYVNYLNTTSNEHILICETKQQYYDSISTMTNLTLLKPTNYLCLKFDKSCLGNKIDINDINYGLNNKLLTFEDVKDLNINFLEITNLNVLIEFYIYHYRKLYTENVYGSSRPAARFKYVKLNKNVVILASGDYVDLTKYIKANKDYYDNIVELSEKYDVTCMTVPNFKNLFFLKLEFPINFCYYECHIILCERIGNSKEFASEFIGGQTTNNDLCDIFGYIATNNKIITIFSAYEYNFQLNNLIKKFDCKRENFDSEDFNFQYDCLNKEFFYVYYDEYRPEDYNEGYAENFNNMSKIYPPKYLDNIYSKITKLIELSK